MLPEGWGDGELAGAIDQVLVDDQERDFPGFREAHSMEKLQEKLGEFFGA